MHELINECMFLYISVDATFLYLSFYKQRPEKTSFFLILLTCHYILTKSLENPSGYIFALLSVLFHFTTSSLANQTFLILISEVTSYHFLLSCINNSLFRNVIIQLFQVKLHIFFTHLSPTIRQSV